MGKSSNHNHNNGSSGELEINAARASVTALETRFTKAQKRLGPRRQQLIRGILDHCEETCFLSSRELARRFDVDPATVVRTVQALGYDGFTDFTADLRQYFVSRRTPYTALKAAAREKRSVAYYIDHSMDKALANLNALRADLDKNRIIELARLIHRSRTILVVGVDMAGSLANYLVYGLVALGVHAEALVGSEGFIQHKIKALSSRDVLIAISFGRCLRVTVEAVIQASKQGVPTFGITDSNTTPIARYCDTHLVAVVASPSFSNGYVAPIAALGAIHVACAHFDPKRSLTKLKPTDKDYLSGARWYREAKGSG